MNILPTPQQVHLIGERSDITNVINSLNIACSSSSFGEGFPNVLTEAMSCGVPCASTACGDAAEIIGDTGRVVAVAAPQALAAALKDLCDLDLTKHQELGNLARQRVIYNYSLERFIQSYATLYQDLSVFRP